MAEDGNVVVAELEAATKAARTYADSTAYGRFISDDMCQNLAAVIVSAVDDARAAATKSAATNLKSLPPA